MRKPAPLPPKPGRLRLTVTPYSFNKRLFEAYDDAFSLVDDTDWICFLDCDAAFLEMSDFGHVLQEYIDKYPETGIFTSYASRCHYAPQMRKGTDIHNKDITVVAQMAVNARQDLHLEVKNMNRRIAGHLIMMQKRKWMQIRKHLQELSAGKQILGFDTKLSYSVMHYGYDIRVMRGVLIFHYLRQLTGKNHRIS